MAEQGLMAPLPLILQPCSESHQSKAEASHPDLLSIQVKGWHKQECIDKDVQWVSEHPLLVHHRLGHAQQTGADHRDFAGSLQAQHESALQRPACNAVPGYAMT